MSRPFAVNPPARIVSPRVHRHRADAFRIEIGCQAGPLAGDGGEWEVVFDGDRVREARLVSTWMS